MPAVESSRLDLPSLAACLLPRSTGTGLGTVTFRIGARLGLHQLSGETRALDLFHPVRHGPYVFTWSSDLATGRHARDLSIPMDAKPSMEILVSHAADSSRAQRSLYCTPPCGSAPRWESYLTHGDGKFGGAGQSREPVRRSASVASCRAATLKSTSGSTGCSPGWRSSCIRSRATVVHAKIP